MYKAKLVELIFIIDMVSIKTLLKTEENILTIFQTNIIRIKKDSEYLKKLITATVLLGLRLLFENTHQRFLVHFW